MKKSTASLLKSVAKPIETKKSASDIPELRGQEAIADELHNAVVAQKDAEVERKDKEELLLPAVTEEYMRLACAGRFTKTINIAGKDTPGIQVSFQDRFSAIPIDAEEELRALDPKFDEHFEQVRSISMKQASFDDLALLMKKLGKGISEIFQVSLKDTSDKTIDTLVAKLGEQDFTRLFEVALSLKAKEHLDEKLHEVPKAAHGFIKQAKGSVKLRASK
jgi:hypothetical protein